MCMLYVAGIQSSDSLFIPRITIGNNINQLTRLTNSGVIRTVYLDGVKEDMKKIWTNLNDIWMQRL